MKAIAVVRRLHRWIGLATGAVIAVVSLTGAVLVYAAEIERALYPELSEVSPASEAPLPVSALIDILGERHPQRSVRALELHRSPDRPVIAVVGADLRVFIHPASGEIIAERVPSKTFYGVMEGMHTELLAGKVGHTIVVVSTAMLLIVILLGIWLWWPQTRAKLGSSLWLCFRRGWRRANYDLHNVLGFYSALVLVLLAATGVMLAYPGITRSLGRVVFPEESEPVAVTLPDAAESDMGQTGAPRTGGAPTEVPPTEVQRAGVPTTGDGPVVDLIAAHAAEQFPRAIRTTIRFSPPRGGPLTVIKGMSSGSEGPETHRLIYDARTGQVLSATASRRTSGLVGRIHLGTVYGWPTKALAFLVSFIAGTLPITGAIVWFPRWRRKRRRKRKRAAARAA